MESDLLQLIKSVATDQQLDPALVAAVVEQESSGDPRAVRYERDFYYRYVIPLNLRDETEGRLRAFSWGLMQIMGQVARELGFTGHLSWLCEPQVGLVWGCKKLKQCLDESGGSIVKGLMRYNGGANPSYPTQVAEKISKYVNLR